MRFFGSPRKTGEVRDVPGVSLISCGLNYAAFNAAVLSEPLGPDPLAFRQRIQVASDFFRSRNLRWTYWYCDDYLASRAGLGGGPGLQNDPRTLFGHFGMSPLTDPAGMFAAGLLAPRRRMPELEMRRVENDPTRRAFAHITSVAFEIPLNICLDVYGSGDAWSGDFHGFVGYAGQLPVTTTATVVAAGVVGVYSVGTLPRYRRLGYAEALMRQALSLEKERTGVEASILQATDAGMRLYRNMGYRKVTRFSVYIS